jgi:hypothetical protein
MNVTRYEVMLTKANLRKGKFQTLGTNEPMSQ